MWLKELKSSKAYSGGRGSEVVHYVLAIADAVQSPSSLYSLLTFLIKVHTSEVGDWVNFLCHWPEQTHKVTMHTYYEIEQGTNTLLHGTCDDMLRWLNRGIGWDLIKQREGELNRLNRGQKSIGLCTIKSINKLLLCQPGDILAFFSSVKLGPEGKATRVKHLSWTIVIAMQINITLLTNHYYIIKEVAFLQNSNQSTDANHLMDHPWVKVPLHKLL